MYIPGLPLNKHTHTHSPLSIRSSCGCPGVPHIQTSSSSTQRAAGIHRDVTFVLVSPGEPARPRRPPGDGCLTFSGPESAAKDGGRNSQRQSSSRDVPGQRPCPKSSRTNANVWLFLRPHSQLSKGEKSRKMKAEDAHGRRGDCGRGRGDCFNSRRWMRQTRIS